MFTGRARASSKLEASNGAVAMLLLNPPTIRIQIRDHEYAPWRDVDVKAASSSDNLEFLHFESSDGQKLRPVHRSDARQRNPDWTRMSLAEALDEAAALTLSTIRSFSASFGTVASQVSAGSFG
jgi:hypothetical protein